MPTMFMEGNVTNLILSGYRDEKGHPNTVLTLRLEVIYR